MAKVSLEFSKSNTSFPIMGWLIMLCEKSNFSHASIRTKSNSLDRDLIYQATGSGVYFIGEIGFNAAHQIVESYSFEFPDDAKTKLLQWAIDNSGKSYGRLELVGLGLVRACKLLGLKIHNPFATGDSSYVCCKLVAAALQELGYQPSQALDDMDLLDTRAFVIECFEKQKQTNMVL